MKNITLIFFGIIVVFNLNAQFEYSKWYFGNQAGIDFTSGTPTVVTNSAMNALDNPASVADSAGNLLFYCDGTQVWNRNHQLMPNGSGLFGHLSGGHAATAIRQPGSYNIYYLVTMTAFGWPNGLRYSVIDMSLDGGLGDIVSGQKNIALKDPASEQVIPVMHANGKDVWLITHEWSSTNFNTYLITCQGLQTTPVVSNVGQLRGGNGDNALGQINVSTDGRHVATACYGSSNFELFDFDNSTGTLSNAILIPNYTAAWGLEFSPDGSKLYLTGWYLQDYLYQFDLSNYTQAAISASAQLIGNITGPDANYKTGYMQLAPDGKIYIAVYTDSYLAVINNPNVAGTGCTFVDDGFYLGGKVSAAGLPDKVVSSNCNSLTVNLGADTVICPGSTVTLNTNLPCASYTWSDGSTGPTLSTANPSFYWVQVNSSGCIKADSIIVTVFSPNQSFLDADTAYCGNFSRTLSSGNANTVWSTGANGSQITVNGAGLYWAQINLTCGTARDTINLFQLPSPQPVLGPNLSLCTGDSLTLNASVSAINYLWSTGETSSSIIVNRVGNYWVQSWDTAICKAADSLEVFTGDPTFYFGADTTICGAARVLLSIPVKNATYQWQNNSTDSIYTVSQTGTYSATVSTPCGTASDEILVQILPDECQLHMPTAFSPNSDGVNDVYRGVSRCGAQRYHLQVYNRWGNLLFETTDVSQGWNGIYKSAPQPTDVYIYQVEYFNYCAQKQLKQAGNFTLLR
ncbi:MAG: gliding motility-associated C-terminal domain-containing protein [Chitinophagales bacterium]